MVFDQNQLALFSTHIPLYSNEMKVDFCPPDRWSEARLVATRAFNINCLGWYTDEMTLMGTDATGKIVSCCSIFPNPLWYGSSTIPGCAVGNVATDPTEQKRGYAGALMIGLINLFRERGWWVSPLWPFSFAFYRKYGWEQIGRDLRVFVWPEMLKRLRHVPGEVRTATLEDLPAIQQIYNQQAVLHNCQTHRELSWWEEKARWGTFLSDLWVFEGKQGVTAYAITRKTHRHRAEGYHCEVLEMNGVDMDSISSLGYGMKDLEGVIEFNFLLPKNSLFPDLFPDYIRLEEVQRLEMRVLDVEKAIGCLKPPQDLKGKIGLEVYDWVISRDSTLQLTVEMDNGEISTRSGVDSHVLSMDIQTFSQLLSGALSPEEAVWLGKLHGSHLPSIDLCKKLFWGRTPFRSGMEPG